MRTFKRDDILCHALLACYLLCAVFHVYAIDYDYHFTSKCLENPLSPQYGGGIARNPELNDGLSGWTAFGNARIELRTSKQGNAFIVASNRKKPFDCFSQKFNVEKDKMYTISAWVQVSNGKADVAAKVRTPDGDFHTGWTSATSGCWSMLKAGFNGNFSGPAHLYFESKDSYSAEIWADSLSIQPFTTSEWKSHQYQSIERNRKKKVKLQAVDSRGQPLANATILIKQINSNFSIGNAISPHILTNVGYQEWYNPRFKLTVFENEMKWPINEPVQGQEDYDLADAMLQYAKNNNMLIRGHNIVWENQDMLPPWAKNLSAPLLSAAVERRYNSIIPRYKGHMMHWDVDNENIHFSYLESQLRKTAGYFYRKAHDMDSSSILFVNEYSTIENPDETIATPVKYLAKIQEIQSMGLKGALGVGLEGHFDTPNIPYIRSALDILATADLPIWITELDVSSRPRQAEYLNDIMWEVHAHPGVHGIMIWSPWQPQGCYKMCLTDNSFKNLATGDVVDSVMKQLSHQGLVGITDENGHFETSLYHGDYEGIIKHPDATNHSLVQSFNVQKSSTLVILSA